ncbi:MAG: hypothetical protein KKE76_10955 [Gammaproteobacteria bacterium]|nr:hypothetical protein [Gammaproteobacteria bacterium]
MNDKTSQALTVAILRVLRPLIRLLLRHGVSHRSFTELAKWVYVDVAAAEFNLDTRKQTTSRIAVITGLTRKDVARLRVQPQPDEREQSERYNRAARVIGAWLRESVFKTKTGEPAVLPLQGDAASFTELVHRHSGDIPVRALLDELVRVDAVQLDADGKVRLKNHGYIPHSDTVEKINILGTDVALLLNTINHNLTNADKGPRFQRKVAYDNLPAEVLPIFRELAAEEGQALLEKLNLWLAEHDRDTNPDVSGSGRNRAGIGIYYFEEPQDEEGSDV